jgi:hypothetical protein
MSRAPKHEQPSIPLSAALNNTFGVIDFIDSPQPSLALQAASAVPPGMVVGGPPAYLEAHGIRYVPAATLGEPDPGSYLAPLGADGGVGVRRTLVEPLSSEPAAYRDVVSQRELDARVDERIGQFMRGAPRGGRQRLATTADAGTPAPPGSADDVRARLKALRDECEASGLTAAASSTRVLRSSARRAAPPPADYDY